jgi:hypothetical protein
MHIPFAPVGIRIFNQSILIVTPSCGFYWSLYSIFGFPAALLGSPADNFAINTPQERVKHHQGFLKISTESEIIRRNR